MSRSLITLAEKVKLLFENIKRPDGKKLTYEYIRGISDVDPSTVSRIRSGQNQDPSFSNVAGLAKAFHVSLDYFSTAMTANEARVYLQQYRNSDSDSAYFDELKAKAELQSANRAGVLALRASHLDSEALEAVEMMVNYVLKQKGVSLEGELTTEESRA